MDTMRNKYKYAISFLIILFLVLTGACDKKKTSTPTSPDQPSASGTKVNDKAVNFTAVDQNNQSVSLCDYLGQVILVNFSTNTCVHCREEAGHLMTLFNQYKDRGFQIITVLVSGDPSAWAQEYKLTFPVLDDSDRTIWDRYGEGYVPLNLVIDRSGVIRYKKAGYDEAEIKGVIEQYL